MRIGAFWLSMTVVVTAVAGQVPVPQAPAAPAPGPTIPLQAPPDSQIQQRIDSILQQIPEDRDVEVTVQAGVVRLGGTTLSTRASHAVADLVARVEGVVWVDNEIEEETKVESRLAPALTRLRELGRQAVRRLPVYAIALAVALLFALLAHLVGRSDRLLAWTGMRPLLRGLILRLLAVAVLVGGVVLALDMLDATTLVGAVLGVAGLAGLALSFAFRDIAENYLAGILLGIRQRFAVGDLLEIEGRQGKVVRLTSREMVLMTLDGNHLRIPNATVFKSILCNYTHNPLRRFDFVVGVGPDQSLARAQRIGVRTLVAMRGVLADPEPSALVEELGTSSVQVRYYGWVDQRRAEFLKVRSEGIRLVKAALDEAGVEMPEPTQRLRIARAEGSEASPAADDVAPAAESMAQDADVDIEGDVDQQIRHELSTSKEQNLLEDRRS